MTAFTPTVRNVLKLWRWASGPRDSDVVRMDWATEYTQAEALRWLRSRVDDRILRGMPMTSEHPYAYPYPRGRKWESEYQLRQERDGWVSKRLPGVPPLSPSRRFATPEIHRRLGP